VYMNPGNFFVFAENGDLLISPGPAKTAENQTA
jgi:hypothetical protein